MNFLEIPKGKTVSFRQGGELIQHTENINLVLEEDVTFSFTSSFSSVVKSNSPALLSMASQELNKMFGSGVGGLVSGQFKQFGFQTWTGTEPISATLTFSLYMRNDAYKEVVLPAIALTKLCLPTANKSGGMVGPGPAFSSAMSDEEDELNPSEGDEENITAGRKINCRIGNYKLFNIVITRAQPTFSRQTDTRGYPISAKIEMGIQALFSATTGQLDEMLGLSDEEYNV